jgi:hypothetical protein
MQGTMTGCTPDQKAVGRKLASVLEFAATDVTAAVVGRGTVFDIVVGFRHGAALPRVDIIPSFLSRAALLVDGPHATRHTRSAATCHTYQKCDC